MATLGILKALEHLQQQLNAHSFEHCTRHPCEISGREVSLWVMIYMDEQGRIYLNILLKMATFENILNIFSSQFALVECKRQDGGLALTQAFLPSSCTKLVI